FTSFLSHKKEQKGPAPMSQSFLPLARKLLCNITRSVKSCRSLLVAIAWGGATRFAQTYPRLFLRIARHLSVSH
ncbi:MAG: hypothetical protein IJX41_08880, partial [Bacteroidaceae bacterium]|nr:hypothetical protein [Bacteroidaceae bacterium]